LQALVDLRSQETALLANASLGAGERAAQLAVIEAQKGTVKLMLKKC
jgi:hypothetical protein